MPRYLFAGPYDRMFPDLNAGPGLSVELAEVAGVGRDVPGEGQMLHLYPGDIVVSADPLQDAAAAHPDLVLLPEPHDPADATGQDPTPATATARVRASKAQTGPNTPPDGSGTLTGPPAA